MKQFARLFDEIDRTTSTKAKVAAMRAYFGSAPAADAAWAVFFLTGRRLKRLVPSAAIRDWTLAATGLGLIMSGLVILAVAFGWYKGRARFAALLSSPGPAAGKGKA